MNFLKRIGVFLYMLLMAGAGALFLLLSFNAVSLDYLAEKINAVAGPLGFQIFLGVAGGIFVIVGMSAPYRLEKKLKKNRIIAFQNPDGEVTISLSAIEDYIKKIAKGIPGIKDVRSRVGVSKKGINIVARVSVSASANIPELTERIQMEVKNRVQGMLGVEEKINIKMHINKIAGISPQAEAAPEERPPVAQVPYR